MTTFTESKHPRQKTGKFADKTQSASEVTLLPSRAHLTARQLLDDAQTALLDAKREVRKRALVAVSAGVLENFGPGVTVEVCKDYDKDYYVVDRIEDSDGDPIWERHNGLSTPATRQLNGYLRAAEQSGVEENYRTVPSMLGELRAFTV